MFLFKCRVCLLIAAILLFDSISQISPAVVQLDSETTTELSRLVTGRDGRGLMDIALSALTVPVMLAMPAYLGVAYTVDCSWNGGLFVGPLKCLKAGIPMLHNFPQENLRRILRNTTLFF